ncbi:hypothetical protein KBB12_00870 [Candidatus Woesebacteria bacterium]|nr:hypothetical protein [Candidatus Woesebacteria bacterium]
MKVYFTASLRGTQFYEQYYLKIYNAIEKLGHTNLDDEIFTLNRTKYYSELETMGRQADLVLYKKKMKQLQQADVCVFEVSLHSLSIGFQIEKAIHYLKPTIVLYLEENKPYFLDGIEDEKFILRSYNDSNIQEVLKECFDIAQKKKEQRFNFFLSPELLNYLESASKKKGSTKSNYIRNLLEKDRDEGH